MSLDNYQGIEAVDKEAGLVTVRAGTRLYQLGAALHENGLAQINLGDINQQSIAGAVSTGTHGTGADPANHRHPDCGLETRKRPWRTRYH